MNSCPGCGKEENLRLCVVHITFWNNSNRYFVKCKCGWIGPEKKTEEDAVEAWNKRYDNK
jgi:hypothetical protein